jgi:nitrite reductase (NO-forming)
MPETLRDKIRQWYILGFAICLILGATFLDSLDSPRSAALTVASVARTLPNAPNEDARPQSPRAPLQLAAASGDPHDMMAQHAPSQTVGQAGPAVADVRGDAAAGRQVFRKCQACHAMEPGKNILGPSLSGIVGRKAGDEPSYSYSPAMKQANIVWNVATLDAYLADPEKVVPGNKMPFPGLKTGQDRTDVIAYLAASGTGAQQTAAAAPQSPVLPPTANSPPASPTGADIGFVPDARYTLRSGIAEGRMVYIGSGVRSRER